MMISQVVKRYKDFKLSWKWTVKACFFIAFLLLISGFYTRFTTARYFPIDKVEIAGVNHVDHLEMQYILKPLVAKGFFGTNVQLIRERLSQIPWVREAYVRRIWPNEIMIRITEKVPLARWNDDSLISTTGEIFTPAPNTFPTNLPQFAGPLGEQMHMIEYFDNINSILMPLHFKIARFELTKGGSWNLIFSNGMRLNVGYKDILTRISHFVKVYPKIVGNRSNEVDYVDLRYSNGLAVRWKTIT